MTSRLRLRPVAHQVIVIAGASSGIGLATARVAASRGARLVLAARSTDALAQLVREIRACGGDAVAVTADVSIEEDLRRVAAVANQAYGHVDTWINNAAVSAYGACRDVPVSDMRRIMDTNFWGVVFGSRIACAHLEQRGGALINVGSVLSDRAVPLQGVYSASKHAIKAWTDALRDELRAAGTPISVTLIKPAAINTPYAEHARNYLPEQPSHSPPVYAPESVAEAILHAAAHPTREFTVGSAGKLLSIAAAVMPRVTDVLVSRWILPHTYSGRPPRGRAALFEPTEDLRVCGDYPGMVRRSFSAAVLTRPMWTRIAGAAVVAGALYGMRKTSGKVRPKTRRNTVRADQ